MALTEDDFADLVAQVAGIPYEVEALPRRHGLAARGLGPGDRLDDDLGLDAEMRSELVAALEDLAGVDASDELRLALSRATTVGDLWSALREAGLAA